jgi:hypothetical protein
MTTLFGRRLGLQQLSTNQSGTGLAGRLPEFVVGAEDIRKDSTTSESTATYLKAYGASLLTTGLSADTTAVFRIDPPIPGVGKVITWGSTTIGTMGSKIFVTASTGGGAGFQTSGGSSFTCVASSAGAVLSLFGVSTSLWAVLNGTTGAGFTYTTST